MCFHHVKIKSLSQKHCCLIRFFKIIKWQRLHYFMLIMAVTNLNLGEVPVLVIMLLLVLLRLHNNIHRQPLLIIMQFITQVLLIQVLSSQTETSLAPLYEHSFLCTIHFTADLTIILYLQHSYLLCRLAALRNLSLLYVTPPLPFLCG